MESNNEYKIMNRVNNDDCILHTDQSNFLWSTSWACLASSVCALYNKYYVFSCFDFSILLSSLNYWRCPAYGLRRNIDITLVYASLFYQSYRALQSQHARKHFSILFIGMICYPISCYYYNKKKYWLSTYFHSGVHIFGNLSYVVLYSGPRF
jgi:hypothetical protein